MILPWYREPFDRLLEAIVSENGRWIRRCGSRYGIGPQGGALLIFEPWRWGQPGFLRWSGRLVWPPAPLRRLRRWLSRPVLCIGRLAS
jgi:hypothetical protein